MKVLLIDVDGKLPNLVFMKLSAYFQEFGYEVCLILFKKNAATTWLLALEAGFNKAERVFISTLFTWNKSLVKELLRYFPSAEVGGTGWDFTAKDGRWYGTSNDLRPEIEAMNPDYDLYVAEDIYERIKFGIGTKESKLVKAETIVNAGIGFTSRGCVRQCSFCLVSVKEGRFRQVAEISDLLNPRSNVLILLDNNLTADPYAIDKLNEIRDRGLTVDITQGVDVRLLTPELAQALSEVKHLRSLHYAWDLMPSENLVIQGAKLLLRYIKAYKHMCYMLTGYDTTFEQDVYRFRRIREMGVDPYVMPYNLTYPTEKHHHFARWVNGRIYKKCSFDEYEPWVRVRDDCQLAIE